MTAPSATEPNTDPNTIVPDAVAGTDPNGDIGHETAASANGEAAKYRRRLRDAEAERDTLAGRVEALQRAEVERVATAHLVKPGALWVAGVDLADVLNEDGTVDAERVKAAAETAAAELGLETPNARRMRGNHVPGEGSNPAAPRGDTWTDAFKTAN